MKRSVFFVATLAPFWPRIPGRSGTQSKRVQATIRERARSRLWPRPSAREPCSRSRSMSAAVLTCRGVPAQASSADDEASRCRHPRRYRELVEAGINGFYRKLLESFMAAVLNEESKLKPMPMISACVPAIDSFKNGQPGPRISSRSPSPPGVSATSPVSPSSRGWARRRFSSSPAPIPGAIRSMTA